VPKCVGARGGVERESESESIKDFVKGRCDAFEIFFIYSNRCFSVLFKLSKVEGGTVTFDRYLLHRHAIYVM
jgi:hypothetical protein